MSDRCYDDFRAERTRAHQKHGDTSMESEPVDSPCRLAILTEEIGEVAREFNEARHRGDGLDLAALRKELVQCGAMVAAWVSAIDSSSVPVDVALAPGAAWSWNEVDQQSRPPSPSPTVAAPSPGPLNKEATGDER